MGQEGREMALRKYDINNVVDLHLGLYRSKLNEDFITGSNGFIENACCKYFANKSHNVFKIKEINL